MTLTRYENAHIPLWLIKDMCWLMKWKSLGVAIAFPTIAVAIIIAWITRKERGSFLSNIAVCFWIFANSSWMLGEFYEWPLTVYQPLALTLFITGILVFIVFVALQYRKKV